jgi:DNA invertase Pin-like site-specific DNA recombinase
VAVHGYIRTSKPPKRTSRHASSSSPLGIESQRAAILAAYPGADLHVDEFLSGRRATRPALRSMIATLDRGDVLVVVRLDRLARGMRLAMSLEHEIEDVRGARIVSLAGEGTSPDGKPDPYAVFVRRVHQAAAELQVAQAARTTREALAVRRRNGYAATGSPPWGYRLEAGKLVAEPAEQRALELARAWVARCAAAPAPAELARALARAGARNRAGRPIGRDTAGRILRQLSETETQTPPRTRRGK